MRLFLTLCAVSFLFTSSCLNDKPKENTLPVTDADKAQEIVDKAIVLHGGDLYTKSRISFTFRGKRHVIQQNAQSYYYERSFLEDGDQIVDRYDNGTFSRLVNGSEVSLSGRKLARAIEDVNAVSYFAALPYKLNDQAVIKEYAGEVEVKGKIYHKIKVTFHQDGGGHSPDNVFYYWFDKASGYMEYLAYNKGGNRFRAPYNARVVNGIRFVDNINFTGELNDIAGYDNEYEAGKLRELSRIILEDIEVEILK